MKGIEKITADGSTLALIIRAGLQPQRTTFHTDPDEVLQAGHIVYNEGEEVEPHRHLPVKRSIRGTAEAVVIRSGSCVVNIYDESREQVATRNLSEGDTVLLLRGGHGFRMEEDTILLEIKQGPYVEESDKEKL